MEDSLFADAWKDSFDRLLDPRPILRELNIIKKNVNASYNVDSSVENSAVQIFIEEPNDEHESPTDPISTPSRGHVAGGPFRCSLSPVGQWKFYFVDQHTTKKQPSVRHVDFALQSSPIPRCKSSSDCLKTKTQITEIRPKGSIPEFRAGKWRKSLHTWRRTCAIHDPKPSNLDERSSIRGCRKSIYMNIGNLNIRKSARIANDWPRQVLQCCQQDEPRPFNEVYSVNKMENCKKIGEGVYGEVFMATTRRQRRNEQIVLKVIPIEGAAEIMGEPQKTYEQILPEIVITQQLSCLQVSENTANSTSGFVGIEKVSCVRGKYPQYLLDLWEQYDNERESENEHPNAFPNTQLYIVLELKFGGADLESYMLLNAEQSYFVLQQIVFTLAVAEVAFQFEHRDLHWGNILVQPTHEKMLKYRINGESFVVPTKGVKVTIIDYTLSRMNFNGTCMYNDLSCDKDLFSASGDYQFDIYRQMRDVLRNNWAEYNPKTNVFWISYVADKMMNGVLYKKANTKKHALFLKKVEKLQDVILESKSAEDIASYMVKETD